MPARHAEPSRDAAACAAIYAPYVEGSPASFELEPPSAAEMAGRIESTSAHHPWLVLERAEAVVGFAYASQHHSRAAYRWTADVTVYVDQARRRTGAGRELYEALLGLLRRQRMRVVCAGITLPNDASVGLHEALGFELVGVYRNVGWKAGTWYDVGWWQLDLGAPGEPPTEPLGPQQLRLDSGVHP
jgi:L-amino acid N-acyltransferase YncA